MAATKNNAPLNSTGASAPRAAKSKHANIPSASEFEASGAPGQTSGIDASHPAVDDDPRANTTVDQNRIDFNDPTISGAEAVRRNLEEQGINGGPADADVSRKD